MNQGFFQLRTAEDLFSKLQWELDNLRQDPSNPWLAFNFFVTAEHLPDWVKNKPVRKKHTILRICSHLANGGKHFLADPNRHVAVATANRDGVVEEGVLEKGVCEEWLNIVLEPHEAKELGVDQIDAVTLAEQIVDWWRQYFTKRKNREVTRSTK